MRRFALIATLLLLPSSAFAYGQTTSPWTNATYSYAHAFGRGPDFSGDSYHLNAGNSPFDIIANGCPSGGSYLVYFYEGNDATLYTTTNESIAAGLALQTTQYECNGGTAQTDQETQFFSTIPAQNDVVATGTLISLAATGWISLKTINATYNLQANTGNYSVSWSLESILTRCASVTIFCPTLAPLTARVGVSSITMPNAQSFSVSSTTNAAIFAPEGWYTLTTRLQQPATFLGFSSLLGFSLGYTTIVSTTTSFVVGTSTTLTQYLESQRTQKISSTSAEVCIPIPGYFSAYDCTNYLFVPPSGLGTSDALLAEFRKPPFGYFTQAVAMFEGATTSATSTPYPSIADAIQGGPLGMLRSILAGLLWLLLAVWIIVRIARWEFQA
jgi:hypothetical protein